MREVQFHAAFEAEVLAYERDVRIALIAVTKLLSDYGPQLGRPYAYTLKGPKHSNMKELRFEAAEAAGNSTRRRRQIRPKSETLLSPYDRKSGFQVFEHLESLKT